MEEAPPGERGRVVVIAGPDGSGKSTVCAALLSGPLADKGVRRIHHRPRVLPGRATSAGSDRPHASRPYGPLVARAKVLFLFADYLLGWMVRVRPHLDSGGWVVIERGWWDLAVDPARYRLVPTRLVSALGRALPRPDLTAVLLPPAEVVRERKQELPVAEIESQSRSWKELAQRHPSIRVIEGSASVADIVDTVYRAAFKQDRIPPAGGHVGVPAGREPRWLLPRSPSGVTSAACAIYQPMTAKGEFGWKLVTGLTRFGAHRVLPRATIPEEVISILEQTSVRWSHVALARANHAGRSTALILDGREPVAIAKIARTEAGAKALEREAEVLEKISEAVMQPISVPEVLDTGPGLLVLGYVAWERRRDPVILPSAVAHALGHLRLHSGLSHGDCAPWNLLAHPGGFTLIDWEEASPELPELFDPLHYVVQSHSLLGRPSLEELMKGLDGGEGWIDRVFSAYADGLQRDPGDRRTALAEYLRASEARLDPAAPDGERGLRARRQIAAALRP